MKKTAKKKSQKAKRSAEPDMNQLAPHLIRMQTEEPVPVEAAAPSRSEISRVMAEWGRRGGKLGGAARAASMTSERRREIALKAARKRWDSTGNEEKAKT